LARGSEWSAQDFAKELRKIRRRCDDLTFGASELRDDIYRVVVRCAICKSVDFAILTSKRHRYAGTDYAMIGGIRGICEDLIMLSYIKRFDSEDRNRLIMLIQTMNFRAGVAAQASFFSSNNPFQPVIGGDKDKATLEGDVRSAKAELSAFWKAKGVARQGGPTVREMAEDLNIQSVYNYVYFLSSNFVHFNTHALLRNGWGDPEGPFRYRIGNFDGYYKSLSVFCSALLVIGFCYAFADVFVAGSPEEEVNALLLVISEVHRWPEIVTFEELNKDPPLFVFSHALRKVAVEGGEAIPYGGVVQEIKNLR